MGNTFIDGHRLPRCKIDAMLVDRASDAAYQANYAGQALASGIDHTNTWCASHNWRARQSGAAGRTRRIEQPATGNVFGGGRGLNLYHPVD